MHEGTQNKRNNASTPKKSEQILGKQLPANVQAERAILGTLLLNDEQINQVIELLGPDDFYSPAHKVLFEAMRSLVQEHKRVDLIALQDHLEKMDHLQAVGGIVYLIALQEEIPSLGMLMQHAQIVKDKAILRSLINSATSIITNCYSQDEKSISAVLDEAENTIFSISQKRSSQSFVQLNIWLKKTFQHLSDIKSHSKGITGIPTGFKKLDMMSSGFQKGDFIVAAGRPSMGKTALSLSIAANAARAGVSVGFFSLEMAAEQLILRLLSAESGIAHHNIRNATITSDEWIELTNVAAGLAEKKIFIDDTAMQTILDIRTKARKLKTDHDIQMIVIDYLQLLHGSRRHENRHQEVSEISRSLKALAKELNIPIVSLAQLSRAVDSRMDKRPMLSDLRESGAIEQDADLIMFLYRDVVYNPETENPALTELIIGKQRNGPTGTVYLQFNGELSKFEPIHESD